MQPVRRSHRPLIMGRHGAVASNHPVATQAGLDVLRAGGTAVDATIAVSLMLGVVEPHMSGLGGDGFFQIQLAAGAALCVNATGAAPAILIGRIAARASSCELSLDMGRRF
jgi:gamma-glutamyltranspeptidase